MNGAQRAVLALGVIGAGAMAAYPPWIAYGAVESQIVSIPLGHYPLNHNFYQKGVPSSTRFLADMPTLGLQLLMLAAVVAAVALVFSGDWWRIRRPDRDESPRQPQPEPEPSRAPPAPPGPPVHISQRMLAPDAGFAARWRWGELRALRVGYVATYYGCVAFSALWLTARGAPVGWWQGVLAVGSVALMSVHAAGHWRLSKYAYSAAGRWWSLALLLSGYAVPPGGWFAYVLTGGRLRVRFGPLKGEQTELAE